MNKNNIDYPEEIYNLPIYPELDKICAQLKDSPSRFMVLTAETAAGKSTALPLALLKHFDGNILMLEPRRIAAVNISSRVADLLGEEIGETSGYQMFMESKVSSRTRFTVITEAILTKKLQNDPSLDGINVVVIDEFHERSVHADLALAFLKETMELRDDLYVIVMSATIETDKLCKYLDCSLYSVKGRQFPVSIEYCGDKNVSDVIKKELRKTTSDDKGILVFLPGIRDIKYVFTQLEPFIDEEKEELLILHSTISLSEQKNILRGSPTGKKRIILSSSIAETSITVPDITLVIDSGLSRINTFDPVTQMEHLETVRESQFNADQRSGRAGRTKAGRCLRLWNQTDTLTVSSAPEILRSDLSSVTLECAAWGVSQLENMSFLDNPSPALWNSSINLLKQLGLITNEGTLSAKGQISLTLPLSPRLSCVALYGLESGNLDNTVKTSLSYSQYAQHSPEIFNRLKKDIAKKIVNACREFKFTTNSTQSTGLSTDNELENSLFAGFPDRIARLVDKDKYTYQFPGLRKAKLQAKDAGSAPEWIIAPTVDRGSDIGVIRDYYPLSAADAMELIKPYLRNKVNVSFVKGSDRIQKIQQTIYGDLVIKDVKLPVEEGDYLMALHSAVRANGYTWLPLSNKTKDFLLRVEFYLQNSFPSESIELIELKNKYDKLSENSEEWLTPFVTGNSKISEQIVYDALYYHLNGTVIDKNVPAEIILENNKKRRLVYEENNGQIKPVLEIIIQQIFGCTKTPEVMGVAVKLKLLSPARRPLQITEDLANFWQTSWIEICKEMKGRYPKHNWDYRQIVQEE